jgi:hypothetical protein
MKHRTEDDFEQWLHGVTRFKGEREAEQEEVSPEFLAAQRRSIYRRLEEQPRRGAALRWALSAAMLLVMVIGLTFSRLHKPPQTISDEQLFSDLAAMDQSAEPKAIQPMHKLFEE